MRLVLSSVPGHGIDPRAQIDARLAHGSAASIVYVVPTLRMVNLLRREWVKRMPGEASPHLPLYTIAELVATLATAILPARRRIDEDLQTAILERVISALHGSFSYFSRAASQPPGTLATIRNTIATLKERGIRPDDVRTARPQGVLPSALQKMHEIGEIYSAYEERLLTGLTDDPGTLLALNAALTTADINDAFARAIPGWQYAHDRLLVVEGFSEFRSPERDLLLACLRLADTTKSIIVDYGETNDFLFGHLRASVETFRNGGYRHVELIEDRATRWKRLVQGTFFTPVQPDHRPQFDRITVVPARDPREEAATIARIIRAAVRENPGRDISRICVATRMSSTHADLLREALDDAGIPANVTDRFPLDQTSIAIGFLALLHVRLRDFRVRDVARALSSPYYAIVANGIAVDAPNLLSIARRCRVVGGYDQWRSAVERHRDLLHESDNRTAAEITAEERACTSALRDLESLKRVLDPLPHHARAADLAAHTRRLLTELDTRFALLKGSEIAREIEHLERETRAYRALTDVLGSIAEVLSPEEQEEQISLESFGRGLRAAISGTRFNVRPHTGKGVLVTSVEETRGLDIDIMIMAGLVDGRFPLPFSPEVFLRGDLSLSRERHTNDERYLFYQGVTTWTEKLYLTYAEHDAAGRESSCSSFVTELLLRAEVNKELPAEVATAIAGRSELIRDAGQRVACGRALEDGWSADDERVLKIVQQCAPIEALRHRTGEAPAYQGILGEAAIGADILNVRERSVSASRLEMYGRCPFQYFSGRVLRLNAPPGDEDGLSAMEGGTLVHAILNKFLSQRRLRQAPPIGGCSDDACATVERELYELARAEVDRLGITHPFWRCDIDRQLGLTDKRGALDVFLKRERSRDPHDVPSFFEVHFGQRLDLRPLTDPLLSREEGVAIDDWTFSGGIDRIDLGEHDAVIVDYKTGDLPASGDIRKGKSLQLPLYMLAARALLKDRGIPVDASLYYQLKRDAGGNGGVVPKTMRMRLFGSSRVGPKIKDEAEIEGILDHARMTARSYLEGITSGAFPLTDEEDRSKVCTRCEFISVCRVCDAVSGPVR
jgi:ATP-dependent helicase/DNAse subunit B